MLETGEDQAKYLSHETHQWQSALADGDEHGGQVPQEVKRGTDDEIDREVQARGHRYRDR